MRLRLLAGVLGLTVMLAGCGERPNEAAKTGQDKTPDQPPAAKATPEKEKQAMPVEKPLRSNGETVAEMIAAAEKARNKADSVGGEWRDVGKFIKLAKAASEKGDLSTAQKLAERARFQSETGYQQAIEQKNADFPSYMKQ